MTQLETEIMKAFADHYLQHKDTSKVTDVEMACVAALVAKRYIEKALKDGVNIGSCSFDCYNQWEQDKADEEISEWLKENGVV